LTEPRARGATQILYIVHVGGDTFSVEDVSGGVSLVDSATLKLLLKQLSAEGSNNEHRLGGTALV
jgi:hypothetical protein